MHLTTAMVRGVSLSDTTDPPTVATPSFSWHAWPGKKYSLIMADSLSKAPFGWFGLDQVHHYSVFNIDGNDLSTGTASGPFAEPGNFISDYPNYYAYMIF